MFLKKINFSKEEVYNLLKKSISLDVLNEMANKGIYFEKGLTDKEFLTIEKIYDLKFPNSIREIYSKVLFTGGKFYNWRDFSKQNIELIKYKIFDQIRDGILFDVENNDFWTESFGKKVEDKEQQKILVNICIQKAPKLVPIYGQRYMPTEIIGDGKYPVISVVQTDVIYYGYDLYDYFCREFSNSYNQSDSKYSLIPFWTEIILQR